MNKKMLMIAIVIIMVIAGYLYTVPSSPKMSRSAVTGVKVGQTLAPFALDRLDGTKVSVGQSGKVTVLNFWTTWCPPCRDEMPELEKFAKNNQQKVDFYAINIQESAEKISDFMDKNKFTMPVLLDTDGAVGKKFQITAIPTTIIVNKHGVVKYRKSGGMTMNELESIVNSL